MPACPRNEEFSPLPPPGFTGDNCLSKSTQLIELLEKVIDKYRREPHLVEQRAKQTELLLAVAQYTILAEDRSGFLRQIVSTGEDLLSSDSSSSTFTTPNKENDEDFSLDDLASEYLKNEPSPDPLAPVPIVQPTSPTTDLILKSPLELILFSDRLSSYEAMSTGQCSSLGQLLCEKPVEVPSSAKKRVSSCLLDRTLYDRLTRLITLLPKQCPLVSHPTVDRRPPNPRYSEGPRKQRPEFHPRNRLEFTPNFPQGFYPQQVRPGRYRHPQQPAPLRPNYQPRRYNAPEGVRPPQYERAPKNHPGNKPRPTPR